MLHPCPYLSHAIVPLANGYLEYCFVARFHDWRDSWHYVRTVDYASITLQ